MFSRAQEKPTRPTTTINFKLSCHVQNYGAPWIINEKNVATLRRKQYTKNYNISNTKDRQVDLLMLTINKWDDIISPHEHLVVLCCYISTWLFHRSWKFSALGIFYFFNRTIIKRVFLIGLKTIKKIIIFSRYVYNFFYDNIM